MRKFKKRPGPDWVVNILLDDEIFGVTVFGCQDEVAAIHEAVAGFMAHDRPNLLVVSVMREPV